MSVERILFCVHFRHAYFHDRDITRKWTVYSDLILILKLNTVDGMNMSNNLILRVFV